MMTNEVSKIKSPNSNTLAFEHLKASFAWFIFAFSLEITIINSNFDLFISFRVVYLIFSIIIVHAISRLYFLLTCTVWFIFTKVWVSHIFDHFKLSVRVEQKYAIKYVEDKASTGYSQIVDFPRILEIGSCLSLLDSEYY